MRRLRWTLTAAALLAVGFAWPAVPSGQSEAKLVSFAILEDYEKSESLQEVEQDFRLFNQLGIDTWRGSFGWDDYEPRPGYFDFAWLRQFVRLAAQHRINLAPYLGYTPEWAARRKAGDRDTWNNPPRRAAEWTRFADRIAAALRAESNVASFEIYNEENVAMWWDGSARDYARTLVDGARAVRRAHAGARVVFGGLVFPDVEWIEDVCSVAGAARAFDVLPVHAYPETWTPATVVIENYLDGLPAFVAAADRACGRKSIWINETGFATTESRTERDQANWWVRAVATFLAAPRVEHIGVYEIKDLPLNRDVIGDAPNYHLGLTYIDRRPKLAFHTVRLLANLLNTGRLQIVDDDLRVSPVEGACGELHYHAFARPDGDRVAFVWDRMGRCVVDITLKGRWPTVSEYQLDGQSTSGEGALSRVNLAAGQPRIYRFHLQ